MAQHKHWPVGHPYYEAAPWCRFPTKKECEAFYKRRYAEIWDAKQLEWAETAAKRGLKPEKSKFGDLVKAAKLRLAEERLAGVEGIEPSSDG